MSINPNSHNVKSIFSRKERGFVHLVGAGPGDPDLLTIRALQIIKNATVIVYDNLVSREILQLVPNEVQLIKVGKKYNCVSTSQCEINELLITLANQGHIVCRLKGGDPFIFGRGSEEALVLERQGILYDVVPGITAAIGCGAYSGIPLTHRGISRGVTMITAHGGDDSYQIEWDALTHLDHTLIFYMGLHKVEWITQSLINHGMDFNTPIAIISQGTTNQHHHIIATLKTISEKLYQVSIKSPSIIIVGEVVNLAELINWYGIKKENNIHYEGVM